MIHTKTTDRQFFRGLDEVRAGDVKPVRSEIMSVLNITTEQGYRKRRAGQVRYTVEEVAAVEAIFARYGVQDPWGPKE